MRINCCSNLDEEEQPCATSQIPIRSYLVTDIPFLQFFEKTKTKQENDAINQNRPHN